MRPGRNPLDLNNLPEDYTRSDHHHHHHHHHAKQILEDTSSSVAAGGGGGYRKKKNGAKEAKEDSSKVYECRFCSLKFCKSQALGGHMNRHRQERETETLNRARQLVFSNDNILAPPPPHHLGGHGGYHQTGNIGDPTLPFRSVYPARLFSGSSSTVLPPPPQPYMYTSPSRLIPYQSSQYPPPQQQHPVNDYFVGHVLSGSSHYSPQNRNFGGTGAAPAEGNYTCIGAPVGQGFGHGNERGKGGEGGDEVEMQNENNKDKGGEGLVLDLNGGRRSTTGTHEQQQQRLDHHPSLINRYQEGF